MSGQKPERGASGASRKGLCSLTAVREGATGRWPEFRGEAHFLLEVRKNISTTWPWLHFLEVSHSSGRGSPAGFRRVCRFRRSSFAVGLALDDAIKLSLVRKRPDIYCGRP